MTPDRVVIAESMRTFTYLSLYGYLTDAVVVNRVFPDELAGGYFGAWRELQQRELARVDAGFAPVPVLQAPFFEAEVVGGAMLDRLAGAIFGDEDPAALLHDDLAQDFELSGGEGRLRLAVPSPARPTCRSSAWATSSSSASTAVSGRWSSPPRSPACARRAPHSTTAPWWCALVPDQERDTLAAVREHLDEAHAAADRLVREAHRQAEEAARAAAAGVPPRGWQAPAGEQGSSLPDLAPLLALLEAARRSVPPELSQQVVEALRGCCSRCAR